MAMYDAEKLQKYANSAWAGVKEIFTDYKEKLTWKSNENILDVGCGTGYVTLNLIKEILPADSNIVASDISEDMLKYANNHIKDSRIIFKKLDITDNNLWNTYNKGEFSKVFSSYVMHRLSDDSKVYENIYNLLKPGGEMLIFFPITHGLDEISQCLGKLPKFSKYSEELLSRKFHVVPRKDQLTHLAEELKRNGFEEISCEVKTLRYKFPSTDYISDLYGFAMPLDKFLPKELMPDILKEVENIINETDVLRKTDDGGVILHYDALIGFAKKPL